MLFAEKRMTMSGDPQRIWDNYYQRIRRRRIREAQIVHAQMTEDGVTHSTVLALDFRHFGNEEERVQCLGAQLSENYVTEVRRSGNDDNYWLLDGTTRPEGVDEITEGRFVAWVAFMCDVAQSYSCVFSTWYLTDPLRSQTWSNEKIDV